MATCPHINSPDLHPPRVTDSVYREDCTLCFDSIDSLDGLDVCLHCFNGGCAGERVHSRTHAQQTQHPLALNIKRSRKRRHRDEPPAKLSKIAIAAETEEDRYDTETSVHCFECGIAGIRKDQGKVGSVVDGVMKANTFAKEADVKAWEAEITACEHTLCLEQEAGRQIPSGDLGHCNSCDLKENLWLCLICGNLGCGRKQHGGLPGNNHGREHGEQSGHPVVVKLGSLTADGQADIYCYRCDEERIDPELVPHLANWGIDIAGRVRTEKTLTEMNLEENMKWDFSMTDEQGKELEPVFGPGLTGLKNLGNTCYLASVLQSLFAMPEFSERYYRPDEPLSAVSKPADDLEIQLRKVADGLLSGRYSRPDTDFVPAEATEEQPRYQKGLAPSMLKHLVGKGHSEFSTARQQDSFELLLHLLKLISRSQQSSKQNYQGVSDPVDALRFVMEQKLQCLNCKKVRYRQDEMENISVAVPIRRLPRTDATMSEANGGEKGEVQFESVTLKQCLDDFTAPEIVELNCASCGNKGFTKQSLFKTFPTILAVNARRFEILNWVPTKQDVPVIIGDEVFDFEPYRSKGKQPDEEELADDQTEGGPSSAGAQAFAPNDMALEMLMSMGFPRGRCEKALHATGNADAELAASWLFEHMEDPDIDTPLDLAGGGSNAAGQGPSPEQIEQLGMMGFSAPQARQALKETGGDMERAVDWLFNHPEAMGDFGDDDVPEDADLSQSVRGDVEDAKPAKFSLSSIVCHKGTSIHAGHYVAFVKKELAGGTKSWVLFNDEKVALGGDVDEMKKFAYIYFFRREGI